MVGLNAGIKEYELHVTTHLTPLSAGGLVAVVAWLGGVLAADHYLECNDQPSTLCLTRGYSTFELPLRNTANLIKIGESNLREDFTITQKTPTGEISDPVSHLLSCPFIIVS